MDKHPGPRTVRGVRPHLRAARRRISGLILTFFFVLNGDRSKRPCASSPQLKRHRPSQPHVGGEILCGRGGRVHGGLNMAFGHGRVFTTEARFVR